MPKNSNRLTITYPVVFSKIPTAIYLTGHGDALGTLYWLSYQNGVNGFVIFSDKASDESVNSQISWLAVGF